MQIFPVTDTTFTFKTFETSKSHAVSQHPLSFDTEPNIRFCFGNSDRRNRSPKWAKKLGLVDDTDDKRRAARSQWAKRYDERLANSTWDNAELAEGEEGDNYVPERVIDPEEVERRRNEGLWTNQDEEWYNEGERDSFKIGATRESMTDESPTSCSEREAPNQKNWHYPMNFEGTEVRYSKRRL